MRDNVGLRETTPPFAIEFPLSTVRHAGDLDYRLVVVRDCCADPDAEVHAMLLDIVIAKQAAVVTTAEFAGALPGRSS